ncbi:MAG: DegV family protein [Firmicutes bacterium]|nr:DegV family protein [Bacillota bacterium]
MSDYIISAESTVDLLPQEIEEFDLKYIPMTFTLNGVNYKDDLGQTMSYDEFYETMAKGAETKTTSVAVGEYIDFFTGYLNEGLDILHVTMSSGISSTYSQATSAANILKEEFPDRKILVLDSMCAGAGFGLVAEEMSVLRKNGASIEEAYEQGLIFRRKVNHLFVPTDLEYLFKGGRLSRTEALVGGLLNICPMICIDPQGKLAVLMKVKGKKKAFKELAAQALLRAAGGADFDRILYVCHCHCIDDAEKVAELVREVLPKAQIRIGNVGLAMGCHSGPGGVALFFAGDRETWI